MTSVPSSRFRSGTAKHGQYTEAIPPCANSHLLLEPSPTVRDRRSEPSRIPAPNRFQEAGYWFGRQNRTIANDASCVPNWLTSLWTISRPVELLLAKKPPEKPGTVSFR